MLFPKQKLSIQITDLYIVIISADNPPFILRAHTHQRKHLNKLTS